MMQLLHADGAWLAIGISVFFLVVGLVMKRIFIKVLREGESSPDATATSTSTKQYD